MSTTRSLLRPFMCAAAAALLFCGPESRFAGAALADEPVRRPVADDGTLSGRIQEARAKANRPCPHTRSTPQWQLVEPLEAPSMELDPYAPVVDVGGQAAAMPPVPGDLEPTIDVQITQEIIDKATELGTVEAMYEFVRNECAFQAYYGSQKGSVETLRQRAGNDYDLASLLIAFLRASNIPARYAVGMVEMPVERVTSWLAVDDARVAGSILFTTGLEGVSIVSGPDVVATRCRRVWVEAYVPRGYGSPTWVPLDPAFSLTSVSAGLDIPEEMGLDAQNVVDEYWDPSDAGVTLPRTETIVALLEQDIQDYLDVNHLGMTVNDVMRKHELVAENLGLLPASLPYVVRSRDSVFSDIPTDRRYQIRVHLHDGATNLIDHTMNLPEIAGRRITVDYVGATPADEAIIDVNGGIYATPPATVNLKPVLRVEGAQVAIGAAGLGMGVQHSSDVHFLAPVNGQGLPQNVVPAISNVIICGAAQALGLAVEGASEGLLVAPPADDLEGTLPLLYDTAMDYMASVRNADLRLGALMHSYVTTGVTSAILENVVTVTAGGFDWKGLRVDADRSIVGVWPVDRFGVPGEQEPTDFLIIGGADGSVWEHHIFEMGFGQDSVSTIKILELAIDAGVTVYKRWGSLPLPANTQPASVRNAIENAILGGNVVTFPADPMTVGTPATGEWSGTGWIDMNPSTGAAGYLISGGNNGGATVEFWPPEFIDLQAGDRAVVNVEIEITTPSADSPDPGAVYTRDNEEHLEFEYLVHVDYDDGSSATLGPYTRTTRNTTKTFWPGNYTFHVWIARFWWWGTIASAERDVSIVGVLIRRNDGSDAGASPPKYLPVEPAAGPPLPSEALTALVIPEQAPNGTAMATGYQWSGGPKLMFDPASSQNTLVKPASQDPSAAVDDQDVDVVVSLVGGKTAHGFASFNFAAGGTDQAHKMTVYRILYKKADESDDAPEYVAVGDQEEVKGILEPDGVEGSFEDWTTTSSKVTFSYAWWGLFGKEIAQVNAGDDPSDAIEDVEVVPNFKSDGAATAFPGDPHKMTVYGVVVKAEDGTSDPPDVVVVETTQKLKGVMKPTGITGQFEDWTTTSSKVTLAHPSPGPLGKDVVEVTAGTNPSNDRDDEEIVPNFKLDGAATARAFDPHKMTVLRTRLKQVSFSGVAYHTIREDNDSADYSAPHWRDDNSDGDASDAGERRYPLCFTRGTKMKIDQAKFICEPAAALTGTPKIKGDGPGSADIGETNATVSGNELTITNVEAGSAFPNEINLINPMSIAFELKLDGDTTWSAAGASDNRVYTTLAASTAGKLFETLLDVGCRNAAGGTVPAAAVTSIWGDFSGPIPGVTRKPMDGHNVVDGVEMKYWNPPSTACQNLAAMLAHAGGNGTCVAWSQLLHETLKAQGIAGSTIREITADPAVNPGANAFMVKNWAFGRHVRTGPDGLNDTALAGDDVALFPVGQGFPDTDCITAGTNLATTPAGDDAVVADTVTTGPNGVCNTTKGGNDTQTLPVGRGHPDQTAITAGPNGTLDTTAAGDDGALGTIIHTGADGICQTPATGDDVQVIPVGSGQPNTVCVTAGTNLITIPAGDDATVGDKITTGANGECETTKAGNDVQVIPLGQGEPDDPCVMPGPDGVLNSTTAGDDTDQDGVFQGTPYPYLQGYDAVNLIGIPGQGNPEPPEVFLNHFITLYGGEYWDPSYGAGPYASQNDHENAAIDGIVSGQRAKKNDVAVQELRYMP